MFKPGKLILLKKFVSDNSIATIKYNGQGFNPLYRDDEINFLHAEQPVMFMSLLSDKSHTHNKIIFLNDSQLWITLGWMSKNMLLQQFSYV